MACASCSRPLPEGARFCPYCGHEVLWATPDERRVVTVLFADIAGYTTLTERLDPERVKRLLDDAFHRLAEDIVEFGGSVDKVLGDGILALFGAPVAHEDDADRAIRAALAMHGTIASFSAEHHELAEPMRLRVGVNTGEALVGALVGLDDYTAMGDVVNVAARLQTMAPPGSTYIGDETASLASAEIVRDLVDEVAVRGREQTERVWRVVGRRAVLEGPRHRGPFVGRANQRTLLRSLMSMVAGGQSAVVSVSGEPGVGKTRLVNEALREFPSRHVVVFTGACAPYGESNVWSPIASALFRRMGLDPVASPDVLRSTCRSSAIELFGFDVDDVSLDRFVEAVLHLFGQPSMLDELPPLQARETLFRLLIEGMHRRTRAGPVVLWIDDLQWAGSLLTDLLHRMTRALADRPFLVVTAQRDDAEIDWPPSNDHPITVRMPLDPFGRAESDSLVQALLGGEPDPVLVAQLYERSGGNPMFLTGLAELARSDPDSTALPGSLRALIAARLDRLPPGPRAIIDNAAVLGASGKVIALEEFATALGQVYDADDLTALVEEGLLDVVGGNWRFRSDVVREVAYLTLTKSVRAQRHAGTAAIMRNIPGAPIDEIAHHAATAAELVAEVGSVRGVMPTIAEQAVELLREAAQRSLDVGALGQATHQVDRALDLDAGSATLRRELLLLRAEASTERRDVGAALADAELALAEAVEAGDRHQEGVARRLLGMAAQMSGDVPRAQLELGRSVELFRELGDDYQLGESLRERGFAEIFGGSLRDAEWLLGEAESLSERVDDRRSRAWVRQHQAWVAFLSGNRELAVARLQEASREFEALGDRSGIGWANGLLAFVRFYERRFDEAEELATAVRAGSIEQGDLWGEAIMDALVAAIRLWSGHFVEAEELSRRALAGFRVLNDRFGLVQALTPRIRALVALGRTHEAERGLEEVLSMRDALGELALPTMAAAGTAVHLGLGERGVSLAETAVEQLTSMGADGGESRVTLALALCQAGRPEEALSAMLLVHDDFPYALAVRALAAAMIGDDELAAGEAERLAADGTASYLDRVVGSMAAATVHVRRGELDAAANVLAEGRHVADRAGDAVARALAWCTTTALLDGDDDQGPADHLRDGWHTVIHGLAGTVPHSSVPPGGTARGLTAEHPAT